MVMFTRLLEIRIVARSCSLLASIRQALRLPGSSSSLSSSISVRDSPKYAISLPDTKAEISRQQKAINIMEAHDTQSGGAINSTACESNIRSEIVGEGDGKGSVSKMN